VTPDRLLVVADSGPLIALAGADGLELLHLLYQRVVMPTAVRQEIAAPPPNRPGAAAVLNAHWLEVIGPVGPPDPFIVGALDSGEAAVIALARTLPGAVVLMDERRGRRVASTAYGLEVVGTVGILVRAKKEGLIASVAPLVARIVANGYFLSEKLVAAALVAAGE
jgi:predicted nucleic acid-binding protein